MNVYFRIAGGDPPYEISWVLAEETGDGEVLDKGEEKTEDARYSFSFTPDYQGDAIHLYLYARDRYDRHTYTVGIWEYVLSEDPNGAKPAAPVGNYFDGTDAESLLYLLLSGAAGVPGRGL